MASKAIGAQTSRVALDRGPEAVSGRLVAVPGASMADRWPATAREREAWAAEWIELARAEGVARVGIGRYPAPLTHWWKALRRRGLGRIAALRRAVVGRLVPIELVGPEGLPLVHDLWLVGAEGSIAGAPGPAPDGWQEWWALELTKDLMMLCCLVEWRKSGAGRACGIAFDALLAELAVFELASRAIPGAHGRRPARKPRARESKKPAPRREREREEPHARESDLA